ncbi:hypothetical protein BN10_1410008 [Phycicoccus elongatus Lp2]|uniref:Uncharacterized protein n=1 Tax=Phycicoccus elongatus Lp2 TaxID=1193181 RepID=N0E0L5_9MICO|nr:hypothetical protein BN10_1410008 [Phycicoccus elongatus Lp2]
MVPNHVDEFNEDRACTGRELLDGVRSGQFLAAEQQIARVADGLGQNLVRVAEVNMGHGRHEERFGAEPPDPVDERVIVFP